MTTYIIYSNSDLGEFDRHLSEFVIEQYDSYYHEPIHISMQNEINTVTASFVGLINPPNHEDNRHSYYLNDSGWSGSKAF